MFVFFFCFFLLFFFFVFLFFFLFFFLFCFFVVVVLFLFCFFVVVFLFPVCHCDHLAKGQGAGCFACRLFIVCVLSVIGYLTFPLGAIGKLS